MCQTQNKPITVSQSGLSTIYDFVLFALAMGPILKRANFGHEDTEYAQSHPHSLVRALNVGRIIRTAGRPYRSGTAVECGHGKHAAIIV